MRLKKWKRAAAWLLTGTLFVGIMGCGNDVSVGENENKNHKGQTGESGTDTEVKAKGRYIEIPKETPEGLKSITDMVRLSDGSVALLNLDTGDLHISPDNGDSWDTKPLAVLTEKIMEQAEITSAAIAADGGVFFSYVNWNNTVEESDTMNIEEHYIYINAEGETEEILLDEEQAGHVVYLSEASFVGETTLAARAFDSIYRIDLTEKTIQSANISQKLYTGLDFAGEYLFSAEAIYQFSVDETIEDTVLSEFIQKEAQEYRGIKFDFDSEEKIVYSASESGLYSHVLGGSTMEKLLDGGLSNLGDPSKNVAAILKNADDSFLIAYEDGEIDSYTYDAEAPSVPDKQLTIYSLEENVTVSKAVSMYRKNYPDIYVKQEIGMAGEYGMTREDAIKNLNTRLLAGEGPDILILDGMPMDSYIEKNILMDLDAVATELEGKSTYFSSILRAYQKENGLYAIPMRYEIPILVGKSAEIEGVFNLEDFAKRIKTIRTAHENTDTLLGTYTAEALLKRLYMTSSPALKEGTTLNKEAIKDFLTYAAEIYEEEQKNITDEMLEQYNAMLLYQEEYGLREEMEGFDINSNVAFNMIGNIQVLTAGTLSSMEHFQVLNGMFSQIETGDYTLLPGQAQNVFCPEGIVGISAKTKEKELAVSFVEELLGEEVQKSDLGDGFPVNANAYESFTQNTDPENEYGFVASTVDEKTGKETRVEFVAEWPDEEQIAALKEKIYTLTTPMISDEVIKNAVIESGVRVLEGAISIEDGCDEILQKVELYLAE